MKLDIIIRIHDGQNIHGNHPRYIDVPKKDLIVGCLTSLINSANYAINNECHQGSHIAQHPVRCPAQNTGLHDADNCLQRRQCGRFFLCERAPFAHL